MLSKSKRLSSTQVREVLARGRGKRGSLISLKKLEKQSNFGCSVVVPLKIARGAVVRNKVRRAVYQAMGGLPLPTNEHMVLFVHQIPKERLTEAYKKELIHLFHV
jgi:RNase P protein component